MVLTNVPPEDALAQPPHSGLATNLLVCRPWPRAPGNRRQVPGSVEGAPYPGWPRGGRRQDLQRALEEGASRARAYLGGDWARRVCAEVQEAHQRLLGARQAGVQQRPGNLGDDIGACGRPGVRGRPGRSVAWSPGLAAGGARCARSRPLAWRRPACGTPSWRRGSWGWSLGPPPPCLCASFLLLTRDIAKHAEVGRRVQ